MPLRITQKKENLSSISTRPDLGDIIDDVTPSPEQIVGWCTQYNNPTLTNALVAAFQHSNFRGQSCPPLEDKNPAALCLHLHCPKMHSPDDCCICSSQQHPIKRCWHVIGLPMAKVHMLEQFKAQQASGAGPWTAKDVKAIYVVPDPYLRIPELN
jgi:hypothetical protein